MAAGDAVTLALADRSRWLAAICARARVIAPTAGPCGDVLFAPVHSPDEVLWEFENPLHPPKAFLLPQTDPLVRICRNGGRLQLAPVAADEPAVLFNVRSCDASAFAYLQGVFARDLPDPAYARRAARTTIVSLACVRPCESGFCVCSDGGPFLRAGFDLQLVALGARLLVEVGSAKGQALVDAAGDLFRPATDTERAERQRLEATARAGLGTETCHFGSAMRRLSTRRVPQALWDTMSGWCLECGSCTHVCPTCYCFSVRDRAEGGGWTRMRLWDSCQYEAFTREASGHNPRRTKGARMWRRFYHKVSAQYCAREGGVGCVGCGRCVRACLGTTDMPAVVGAIRRGEWHG